MKWRIKRKIKSNLEIIRALLLGGRAGCFFLLDFFINFSKPRINFLLWSQFAETDGPIYNIIVLFSENSLASSLGSKPSHKPKTHV